MNHLYYFSVIADHGSISMASKKLHITQPALSHQLKQLEMSLECKLFDRVGRKLILNDKGDFLLEFVNKLFRETDNMIAGLKSRDGLDQAKLIIGVEGGIDYNYVYEFLHPMISNNKFSLEVIEGTLEKLKVLFKKHKLDLVLSFNSISNNSISNSLTKGDFNIHSISVKAVKMVLVAPNKLNATRMGVSQLFESFPLLRYDSTSSFDTILNHFLLTNELLSSNEMRLSNFQAVKNLLLQGRGIGVLPVDSIDGIDTNVQTAKFFIVKTLEDFTQYVNATYMLNGMNNYSLETLVQSANDSFHSHHIHEF